MPTVEKYRSAAMQDRGRLRLQHLFRGIFSPLLGIPRAQSDLFFTLLCLQEQKCLHLHRVGGGGGAWRMVGRQNGAELNEIDGERKRD